MDTSNVVALFVTMLVLSAAPGPSDFAVVSRALAAGFRQALFMVLGIVAADLLFIVVAVSSLSALAERFSLLFMFVCAAYLLWLAYGLFRTRPGDYAPAEAGAAGSLASFTAGFLITLSDPKAILFYMGLLPAFVDMTAVGIRDAVIIMLIATVVICTVKLSYAYLAHRATALFHNDRLRQRLNYVAGGVLGGTGLFIVCSGITG